ncbi:MAG: HAMP domain-containing sensor histidine kinase [Chloroflexi bacterium]|nr:HAMP domain-containing sensor histidine kinase [Chloroflexota bacterium]
MGDLVFQSRLPAFIALIIGVLIVGAILGYFIRRRISSNATPSQIPATDANLYLAFSRLSHHLKSSGEIVRGHLRRFTNEVPSDAERWRVARRTIFDEANQITAMVERLDLLVRIGMTDQPLVMEPINVPGMIEDLMMGLAPAADEKGIVLGGVVESTGDPQPIVSGDPSAFREVFSNIIENAIVHGSSGSEVAAELHNSSGRVRIRIRDTGPGMSDEQLRTLFRPGAREHQPGVRSGTGMGLYLCKLLVELHGGTVTASSKPGSGTMFEIDLPLRRIAD